MAIPNVIHYCWFGNNKMSSRLQNCIKTWILAMPKYEIREWNDDDLKKIPLNKFVKEAYECKQWAFVSDYIRLFILYTEGGIYLDTDVVVFKSLNDMLDNNFFSAIEYIPEWIIKGNIYNEYINDDGTIKNGKTGKHVPGMGFLAPIMEASAKNNLIKAFMDYYENRSFINNDGSYYNEPNTHTLELIAYNFGFRYKNVVQRCNDGITFYPNTIFGNNTGHYNESQYALHFCTLSWKQKTNSFHEYIRIKLKRIYKSFKRTKKEIDVDKLIDNTIQMLERKKNGT
jgi:hypothetical protein